MINRNMFRKSGPRTSRAGSLMVSVESVAETNDTASSSS